MASRKKTSKSKAKTARTTRKTAKKATRKSAGTVRKKASKTTKKTASRKTKTTKKKTAAKKTTARKATSKKTTAKKAAKKTTAKSPPKKKVAKTTKKTVTKNTTKRKAAKTEPAKKTSGGTPKAAQEPPAPLPARNSKEAPLQATGLGALPTDQLWSRYHTEVQSSKGKGTKVLEELRNALIERHYPLVRYIAERLLQTLPKSIELDDLISAGLFGLMDAIRGFDASRGIKFKTYCSTRIRGSILDQLRSQDWVPRLVRLKASKIEKALQKLTGAYGREPTHAELAKTLEMEHGELVKEIQDARAKTMFSLSEKWEDGDEDGSAEKVEILEDKAAIDPVAELNRDDLMAYITRSLTQKERFIIERYYRDGHTMREIGELLSLTESRVCQIHSNVMGRLKNLLSMKEESLLT